MDTGVQRYKVSRLVLGVAALASWILFFSGGLLLETIESRRLLAPQLYAVDSQSSPTPSVALTPGISRISVTGLQLDVLAPKPPVETSNKFLAFLFVVACYTPTNLVFLTLSAGLLGGCASNLMVGTPDPKRRKDISPASLRYLSEDPVSGMIRSFLVYLCVIGGLYFIVDDPFRNSTPSQYMKLAGMLSVLAFVVGYDPSRIEHWIRLIPDPHMKTSRSVTVTASQGKSVAKAAIVDEPVPSEDGSLERTEFQSEVNGEAAGPRKRKAH
jgi:hypothetical protein